MHPYCTSFYTIYARSHMRTEDFFFFFFSARKKNCHRHVNRFGDIPFISLLCNRAKAWKRYFANLNLRRWELLSLLDYKHKDITAKHQDERIASSTYRNYSYHFAGSTHFLFCRGQEDGIRKGGGGVEVNGTTIDISLFYLPHEFFLSLELRRHTETTLPNV